MNDESLIESLLPAVQQQIESKDTPYVKKTFTRLIGEEQMTEDEAMAAIALCLADESNRMYIDKRNFDEARYQELLESITASADEE